MNIEVNRQSNAMLGYCIIFAIFISGLVVSSVIASKIIIVGSITLPASVFIWALTYPCSDIIADVYGRKLANNMVLSGFIAYILCLICIQSSIFMPAAPSWSHQAAYAETLGTSLRPALAALISYVVTQFLDVYLFDFIKKKTKNKYLWLRNNGSTFLSQTTANVLFLTLGFWETMSFESWSKLFMNNLSVRYILVLIDTALVYAGVYILYRCFPILKNKT